MMSRPESHRPSLALPAGATFLGAFLLFQVQPLVAKRILPWFGGSAAVWTVCMLFFQGLLLLGYLYAHLLQRLAPRKQAMLHGGLLLLSLLWLPLHPNPSWKPLGGEEPTLRILGLLASTVGLPYLLLSATSPLVQAWLARERPGFVPYRLFALSNFGSLLALLSYPLLVEPFWALGLQSGVWSACFAAYALLMGFLAWRASSLPAVLPELEADESPAPSWGLRSLWVGLAAGASLLLLAVTAHLSSNVAPIPFLWVLPLLIYLLSFILTFESARWYRRRAFLALLPFALGAMALLLMPEHRLEVPAAWQLAIFGVGLFIACMAAHGELARLRPHPRDLTGFYVAISLGGALGGLFAGLVAPRLFPSLLEFPLALVLLAALACAAWLRDPGDRASFLRRPLLALLALGAAGLALTAFRVDSAERKESRLRVRNFYGSLRVKDETLGGLRIRMLMNGVINHGGQFLEGERLRQPTTYYAPASGVGEALQTLQRRGSVKAAVIGLGSGDLLAYARPGDDWTVYEINPLVRQVASTWFTLLPECPAAHRVVMGDARLSLEREPAQGYDLLAVDAFTSDSIPVHLLTKEAFELYRRHLRPGGVLAVHISNRYLDLEPVVGNAAKQLGWSARMVSESGDDTPADFGSDWVLLSSDPSFFADKPLSEDSEALAPERQVRPWTDDFSNLYKIFRWHGADD